MHEESKKTLRELALSEPLEERARFMLDVPAKIPAAMMDSMPAASRNALTKPATSPLYALVDDSYVLQPATLTAAQKKTILASLPNGIKMVRVSVDEDKNQAALEVHFFNNNYLDAIVAAYNAKKGTAKQLFPISGGSRIRAGSALGQVQVDSSPRPAEPAIARANPPQQNDPILILIVKPIGDYSTYTLQVRTTTITDSFFDPLFAEIRFKFRPGCFNTNCSPDWEPAAEPPNEPVIDYLAKDYGSFRSTMIEAMMERVPGWEPTSEADLDMVLADLFSVAADELSDYQDRVMNEAYLSSARKRVSIARHARMMDYHIHQGNQASTWLALELDQHGQKRKGFQLLEGLKVWAGETTAATGAGPKKEADSSAVFMSRHMEPQAVHQHLNSIALYTWSDTVTTLKAGSTTADLKLFNRLELDTDGTPLTATAGGIPTEAAAKEIRDLIQTEKIKYLLLEEHLNPRTGLRAGRDPSKRKVLQLLPGKDGAVSMFDPIAGEWFVRVNWRKEDALDRDYCFTVDCPADAEGTAKIKTSFVSLFHGNLVEIFHGREKTTLFKEEGEILGEDPDDPLEFHHERTERWGTLCRLPEATLAYRNTDPGGDVAPVSTLEVKVKPPGGGAFDQWNEVPSLIHSDDSAENGDHFVVETDENRRSVIRFGNGKNGMELPEGAVVQCRYQYGEPLEGNVGADMVFNFDDATVTARAAPGPPLKLRSCWNPFDVTNGRDREPVSEIIRRVPEAYRYRQLRAVTLTDYVGRAEEIKGVSRATAKYLWTGSWRTVRLTIDPAGTSDLSYELRQTVESYLNAVRLIGEDIEVRPPLFVPLEIKVKLCAAADYWPEDIRFILEQEFSSGWTPDGRKGFFHPDLWTFGQPLYASQIIGQAMKVKGVEHVVAQRKKKGLAETISVSIKRWNSPATPTDSFTQINYNEIIQVKNDPDDMNKGFITFEVKGGRQ